MNNILTFPGISFFLLQTQDPLYKEYLKPGNLPRGDANTVKGILYLFKYIRSENNQDANKAHKFLLKGRGEFTQTHLYHSLLGMSYAFQAKIKTLFGLEDLKKMMETFEKLPDTPEHWQLRFFRGRALYNVGIMLPDIFFISEQKHKAIEIGEKDLRWLIDQDASADPENKPIPQEIITETLETLKNK